ncbi:MAG: cytochrome c [Alphaproteobacteria bacterium]|nr:cytochrome c [Alphaproteobacteria bacterium]MBU0805433.1 cytochrome c [Alphaproteobacteria bacterium]MBU0873379.1 cytochrome c [Alphaproteobacteria bacterium]MBU1401393.1 cytochrome c [Alphaproteobacteria bacterium]MBU1592190.1 cytochrome c [Alphaproteobacteria bacterium]
MKRLLAVLTVVSAALPAAAQDNGDIEAGKALIEARCAACHAIGVADKSPHPDAPAFRTLHEKYPLQNLEEALAEGIFTGHPDMPEFEATPVQIAGIIAYISSLSGN